MADDKLIVGVESPNANKTAKELQEVAKQGRKVAETDELIAKASQELSKSINYYSNALRQMSSQENQSNKAKQSSLKISQDSVIIEQKRQQQIAKTAQEQAKANKIILSNHLAEKKSLQELQIAREKANQSASQSASNNALRQKLMWQQQETQQYREGLKTKNQVAIAEQKLQQEINKTAISNSKAEAAEIRRQQAQLRLEQQTGRTTQKTSIFNIAVGNLAAELTMRASMAVRDFVYNLSNAGVAMDAVSNTFSAGARSMKRGSEEMAFVADVSQRLGLNLKDTYEPYAKFMTSFTRSGGTLNQSRQIFEDLSTAMVSLHLSSDQMKNVFVALEQMANKGTVQAEELKRQLGNALPGAFELAAQSMNVTTSQLMDMMKAGKVMSKDFLPKFAEVVKDSLGQQIGIAANQFNAQFNRMQSQLFLFQATMGQTLNTAITPFVQSITAMLSGINSLSSGFKDSVIPATVLQTALATLTFTVTGLGLRALKSTKAFATFTKAIATFKAMCVSSNLATGLLLTTTKGLKVVLDSLTAHPVILTLTTLSAVAFGLYNKIQSVNKSFEEAHVQMRDMDNNVTGLIQEYSSLSELTNKSSAQQEAFNRTYQELAQQYPTVLNYLLEHGNSIKNLNNDQLQYISTLAANQEVERAEALLQDELNNKWLKLGSTVVKVGKTMLYVLQSVVTGISHVVITLGQAISKVVSIALKGLGEITEKGAFVSSKIGAKSLAVDLDNATKSLKSMASAGWNAGKVLHTELNQALQQTAYWIDDTDIDRKQKAWKNYADTVAVIGQKQSKLMQSLGYTQTSMQNLAKGGTSKDKKPNKKTTTTTDTKTDWDLLQEDIKKTEEALRVGYLGGLTDSDSKMKILSAHYKEILEKQKNVNTLMEQYGKKTEKVKEAWEQLKENVSKAKHDYENALINPNVTNAQREQLRLEYRKLNSQQEYNDLLIKSESLMQISGRSAKQFASTIVDGLFTPLKEGETIWTRFKDAGLDALKSIATEFLKSKMNLFFGGMGADWAQTTGQGLFSRLGSALQGGIGGVLKNPLSTMGSSTQQGSQQGSPLLQMNQQAQTLANTLNSQTATAVNGVTGALGTMTSPVTSVASGISGIAASSVIATAGMAGIALSSIAMAPAVTAAAPALLTMSGALSGIAASATEAATAMSALAVATAANSVAGIPIFGAALAPVAALATGAAIAAGTAMTGAAVMASSTMAGVGQLAGGAMTGLGNKLGGFKSTTNVVPHAKGGVVSSPTTFPMQGGNIGLAGEAGTEVIAPARRMSNGDLGVGAVQPNVVVNNYTNAAVEVKKRPDNSMEIKIAEMNAFLSSSRSNKGMINAQQRMSNRGKQVG